MAYKIMYGDELLYDSYTDAWVSEARLTSEINTSGYFDFTIHPDSPLIDKIEEKKDVVKLYFNDEVLFEGFVESISTDIYGSKDVSCASALSYLGWTLVRPYSTDPETSDILRAPTNTDAFFEWVVDQHNKASLYSWMQFGIGINQGGYMTGEVIPFRENTSLPTTADTIEDEVLSYGGYLFLRYEGSNRILDLYSDVHSDNTQIIDFGVNLIDFVKTIGTDDQYTAVRPVGGTPEREEGDEDQTPLPAVTLSSMKDGAVEGETDYIKRGDVVYCDSAVSRYGYREYAYSNNDILDQKLLARYAVVDLKRKISPIVNIEVKAVDLALYMEGYSHLQCGQAVRIRSKPHDIDMYLMVNSIDLDLLNPSATTYTLGAVFDTLTGEQSAYLKRMTGQINSAVDQVAAIDQAAKDAAEAAKDAITDSKAEFYQSNSPHELLGGSWVESNVWQQGKYTWTRTLVTYGDGRMEYLPNETGVCISGNTGDKGDPGVAGEPGIDGRTSYFHVKYSPVQNPNAGQMTETPDKFIGTYVDFVKNDSDDPSSYTWTQFRGDPGATGIPGHNGADGKTSYLHIAYADSADGKNGFSVSDSKDKLYIGQYTDFEDQDSTDPGRYSWTKVKGDTGEAGPQGPQGDPGEEGAQGPQGDPGTPGVGISAITEYYLATAASTGVTTSTSGWTTKVQSTDPTKRYLWNYEVTTFSDGSTKITDPVIIGVHGATGADGKGIKSIVEWYLVTSELTGVTPSTAGWKTTPDATTSTERYLWNYEVVTYTDGSTTQTTPAIIGTHGETGATGPQGPQGSPGATGPQGPSGSTGKGLVSVVDEWYLSTSSTSQAGGSWSTTMPTVPKDRFLWHRQRMTWSDNTVTYTNPTVSQWVTSTDFKQTTDSIKLTAQGALERIDNLKIGGTNLLIDSGTLPLTLINSKDDTPGYSVNNLLGNTGVDVGYRGNNRVDVNTAWAGLSLNIRKNAEGRIKVGDEVTLSIRVMVDNDATGLGFGLYRVTDINTPVTLKSDIPGATNSNPNTINAPLLKGGVWYTLWATFTVDEWLLSPGKTSSRFEQRMDTSYRVHWSSPKLEMGNTPTDWSACPLDIVDSMMETGVNRATGSKDFTAMCKPITPANGATLSVLDSGSVPGHKSVNYTVPTSGYYAPIAVIPRGVMRVPKKGDIVTVSFNAYARDGGKIFCYAYSDKNDGTNCKKQTVNSDGYRINDSRASDGSNSFDLPANENKRCWYTVTYLEDAQRCPSLIIGRVNAASSKQTTYAIDSIKVEFGDVATPWSPAPEDADIKFSTKAELKVESDRITGVVSEQAGLANRVSTVEQTASGLEVTLGQVEGKVDDASKVATNFLSYTADGLVVADQTGNTVGSNVQIKPNQVNVRNGAVTNASFAADRIQLGINSYATEIDMCRNVAEIKVDAVEDQGSVSDVTAVYAVKAPGDMARSTASLTCLDYNGRGTSVGVQAVHESSNSAAINAVSLLLGGDAGWKFSQDGGLWVRSIKGESSTGANINRNLTGAEVDRLLSLAKDQDWYTAKMVSNLNALWKSCLFAWDTSTVGIPEANGYGMGICISNQREDSSGNWTYQFAKTTGDTSRLWVRQSINTGGWTTWKLVGDAQSDTGWRKLAGTYNTPVGHDGTNGLYYRKTGPMVTVYVNGGGDWGPAITTGGTVIGTLPTGYRPNCVMNYPLGFKGANTHRLEIFPNGQLKGILQTGNATRYYAATAVFPV